MSKKLHIDVRPMTTIIANLGLTSTDINGMICARNASEVATVIVSDCVDAWTKHTNMIEGDDETPLRNYNKKKAFIMPGSHITADRMKQELREHKITVTNNVSDADIFITNANTFTNTHGELLPLRMPMFSIKNGYSITEFEIGQRKCEFINKWMEDNGIGHVLWDSGVAESLSSDLHSSEYDSLPYDTYVYTGLALEILDRLQNGNAETVFEDRVLIESPNMQPLTKDLLDTVLQMYNAGGDDMELLTKILPTIQGDTNHHLIWKMFGTIQEYQFGTRNKDLQHWFRQMDAHSYNRLSPEDFITHYDAIGELTKEGFKYMEPLCRKEIHISNRDLYVFKVEIKPEYREKYLKK
jgi:hypothetical protein